MKKSMCDGPGCGKQMMDAPQARFGSKKGAGSCKCGGNCGPCKSKAKKESDETASDEPDDDRDDNNGMSPSLSVNSPKPVTSRASVVTDSMTAFRYDSPNCKPGNKACGGRCIPQEYDCEGSLRRKAQGRFLGAVGLGAGGFAASKIGKGIMNEGLNSPDTLGYVSQNMGNRYNEVTEAEIFKHRKQLGKMKGGKKVLAGLALTAAAAPLGVGAIVQNVRAFKAAAQAEQEKQRRSRGDSFWASGFESESSESMPRQDAAHCGPNSKNCGEGCIPKSYNCELAQEVDRTGRGYKRNRALAMGAGFAGLGAGAIGTALHSAAPLSKPAQFAAAGLAAAGGAGALGFGIAARRSQKKHANSILAASEDERDTANRNTMQQLGMLWGGTPEEAAEVRSRYRKRKDSFWASGFEHESAESL